MILPGGFWLLTRSTTQRMFLMTPDDEMNNAFLYCLIEAAQKFDVHVILSQMLSDHHHTPFFARHANVVDFYHRFHTNLAKCVNKHREHHENMWSTAPPCLQAIHDFEALMNELVYCATNPVKHDLVEKVHHWPGPPTTAALLNGRTLRARRPSAFRADGPMPAEVEMKLTLPEELGDPEQILAMLRERIAEVEAECAIERATQKRQVVGRRRIKRQSWEGAPTTPRPARSNRPRIAAHGSNDVKQKALEQQREFQIRYRDARLKWLAGEPVVFPAGTYWLRRFANVPVGPGSMPPLRPRVEIS